MVFDQQHHWLEEGGVDAAMRGGQKAEARPAKPQDCPRATGGVRKGDTQTRDLIETLRKYKVAFRLKGCRYNVDCDYAACNPLGMDE